jgi:D-3-phosphoglycerate dehydrogenase
MYKVFLTEPIHLDGVKILEEVAEVRVGSNTLTETILSEAADCDALLIRSANITKEIINGLTNLKVIAKHGIGVDNIDVEAATEKGILVVNAPEANINAVAEHAFAMALALSKNLLFMDQSVRRGDFKIRNRQPCVELRGKTIGLVGLGRISKLFAKKIKALDVEIIAYDLFLSEDQIAYAQQENIRLVHSLNEIYSESDVISIHVPLTKETKGMIDAQAFSKMKPEAFLINVARGHIVDEEALYHALKTRMIRGAALDVFSEEPPAINHPLFELDNIIVSPHNAALTHEALQSMATHAARGVVDFLTDQKPKYIVNHVASK